MKLLLILLLLPLSSFAECEYEGDQILFEELTIEDQELMESACSDPETHYSLALEGDSLSVEEQGPIKRIKSSRIDILDPTRKITRDRTGVHSGIGGM